MKKRKLLIIYYHEVVEQGCGYSYQKIEKDKFEEQMKYLSENGYQTLFFSELSKSLPEKAVIVSFDDGLKSVYDNAFSIMKKYGIKGNVYLPTAYIGNDEHFMDWNMVRDLCDSGVFEMQAHTHNHTDIRTYSVEDMLNEVNTSAEILDKELGFDPSAFCIPFGMYDRKSILKLRKTNKYKYILGSYYGRIPENRLSTNVLPRIGISNDDSIEKFVDKIEGKYDWKGILQRLRLMFFNLRKERVTEYKY